MSKFHYEPFQYVELETIENEKGRFYVTPTGRYPSMTTVLGYNDEKDKALKKWASRVGEREAQRISNQARNRGKRIHTLIENYVLNKDIELQKQMPSTIQSFSQVRKKLDDNLTKIYAIEAPLYSSELRVAGRVDMIGMWNDKTSIIDFKTSMREKYKYQITDYFLQTAGYAIMAEEYNIHCENVVIIIASDDTYDAQVFVEKCSDYKHLIKEKVNAFYSRFPNFND